MALYLGSSKKQNIVLQGKKHRLTLYFSDRIVHGALRSSDGFLLKDINGVFLTVKEENNNG